MSTSPKKKKNKNADEERLTENIETMSASHIKKKKSKNTEEERLTENIENISSNVSFSPTAVGSKKKKKLSSS
jgi:hypothetical protein